MTERPQPHNQGESEGAKDEQKEITFKELVAHVKNLSQGESITFRKTTTLDTRDLITHLTLMTGRTLFVHEMNNNTVKITAS